MNLNTSLKTIFVVITLTLQAGFCYGQKTNYSQFWNEIQFTRTINDKWSTELDIGNSYSSEESSSNPFENNVQKTFRFWGNYYLNPRWKLSAFVAYFDNKDVPEIGQFKSPEWRFALQGTYYIHKIGYTLSTRSRFELRHIRNENFEFKNVYRYRQQIKYLQPINSKVLRKGVIYGVASEEVFLKTGAKVTGDSFVDRNRFNIGAGYLINEDIQIELTYANEYLPRKNGNQTINAGSLTLTFNNFLKNVTKKLHHIKEEPKVQEE